jgi:ABC-type multidrug transport system fused ATPase/permease subunit
VDCSKETILIFSYTSNNKFLKMKENKPSLSDYYPLGIGKKTKILLIYFFLLLGTCLTAFIYLFSTHYQFRYEPFDTSVPPLPFTEYCSENRKFPNFEMSIFRFHDIQSPRRLIQLYLFPKLYSDSQAKKDIIMKSEINIFRSNYFRLQVESIVKERRIDINITCREVVCEPLMVFEAEVPTYDDKFLVSLEVMNPSELYEQGLEAFTTGIVTKSSNYYLIVFIITIVLLIISLIVFLFSLLAMRGIHDTLHIRLVALSSCFVNLLQYLGHSTLIMNGLRELLLASHAALLSSIFLSSAKNLMNMKPDMVVERFLISIVGIFSLVLRNILWNSILTLVICFLGVLSIFLYIFNYHNFKQLRWEERTFSLLSWTYLWCYLYVFNKSNLDFLSEEGRVNLFYLMNSFFPVTLIITYIPCQNNASDSDQLEIKKYDIINITTIEKESVTEI